VFTLFSSDEGSTALFSILLFALLPGWTMSAGRSLDTLEAPALACSSDTPIADAGTSVVLRAWALPKNGDAAPNYTWTVHAGKIVGAGSEVKWDLRTVPASSQRHYATVRATFPSGTTRSCSIGVVTAMAARRGGRAPTRSFLVRGQPGEPQGYGLYSYILLGSKPTTDLARKRSLLVIQAYLAAMVDVEKQQILPPSALNVTYLPIEKKPSDFTAEWLLDNYDYAKAQALLHVMPDDLTDGPYIVSTLRPLGLYVDRPEQYLFQNLSVVPTEPPDLISLWVREFIHQSAQERFWQPRTGALLALNIRTTIAVLAIGLPPVQKSISSWVSWIHQ
jgi:hypothetical protein